jgi:hypothetical protein
MARQLTDAELDEDNLAHAERFERFAADAAQKGDNMVANSWRRFAKREREAITNRAATERLIETNGSEQEVGEDG